MSEPTLTVEARGPVRAVREPEADMAVQVEDRPVVEASFTMSAFELRNIGEVYRKGMLLRKRDVAEHVVEALQSDPAPIYSIREEDRWTVTVKGSVDDYRQVALAAGRSRRSKPSAAAVTAAKVLEDLAAGFAGSERPLLALYDLLREEDPDVDMTPESVLEELSTGARTEREEDTAGAEA